MWDAQWDAYSREFRVLRCDLRGFGRTPLEAGGFSNPRDLIELLEAGVFERVALVGLALGGRVVLEVALARADLIRALVLVGPGLPGHEWSAETIAGWEGKEGGVQEGG